VASAHFHEAVVARRIRKAADLFGGAGDQFGLAEFIDKAHDDVPLRAGKALHFFERGLLLAKLGEHAELVEGIHFADFTHGEADVNQHPVAEDGRIVGEQAEIDAAANAEHVDHGSVAVFVQQLNDFAWYGETHSSILLSVTDL
jgi:hypothetical protein